MKKDATIQTVEAEPTLEEVVEQPEPRDPVEVGDKDDPSDVLVDVRRLLQEPEPLQAVKQVSEGNGTSPASPTPLVPLNHMVPPFSNPFLSLPWYNNISGSSSILEWVYIYKAMDF